MIKKNLKAKGIDLKEDLSINSFFSKKERHENKRMQSYLFVFGLILLVVIALETGIITMMAAK